MKIVLSGVETNNKGAELMLYAILQEIEQRYPSATVYLDAPSVRQGLDYIQTSCRLRYWPLSAIIKRTRFNSILRRLHFATLVGPYVHADYFIDASGFFFSDQWHISDEKVTRWNRMLCRMHKCGARIVFLPQAFGPVREENTKKALAVVGKYASVIMPREVVSKQFLLDTGVIPIEKIVLFPDFTCSVEGVFPTRFMHLRGGICVIPNVRMIDRGVISQEAYLELLFSILLLCRQSGKTVYLLNHEGKKDEQFIRRLQAASTENIECVTGLNALEVKGLIGSSYAVISSRFHGVASALNSCVPCLATSWSHKYQELFADYGQEGFILPLNSPELAMNKVKYLLQEDNNRHIREQLVRARKGLLERISAMWEVVWSDKN